MQQDEQEIIECGECRVPVLTFWSPKGLLRGEYVLIGDVIFHPRCWDNLLIRTWQASEYD